MASRTASCACGQLCIGVDGAPRGVGLCHCLACQKRTGSVFAALASFAASYRVTSRATEYVRTGDRCAKFIFRFCPVCCANLLHTEEGCDGSVSAAVDAFAGPDFPPPEVSVYDCRRHKSVTLPEGVIAFEKDPD